MTIYDANKSNIKGIKEYFDYLMNFRVWYQSKIKEGYDPLLNLDEISNLTNKITLYYEFKYPDGDFQTKDSDLTIKRFKKSLSEKEISILDNRYRLNKKINSSKLFEIIFNHEVDYELRDWIINLSILSMKYSRNTNLEHGTKRSELFKEEITKFYDIQIFSSLNEVKKLSLKNNNKSIKK